MEKQWESMTNREKDYIIANEILCFDCFKKEDGIDWYNRQYSLGHWRYCSNLEDALDLSRRVFGLDIKAHIIMSKNSFECNIINDGSNSILVNLTSETLPDLICQIAVHLRGFKISCDVF